MDQPCLVVGHPWEVERKGVGREVLTSGRSLRSPGKRLSPLVLRTHPL